jgi:hypothetical protein
MKNLIATFRCFILPVLSLVLILGCESTNTGSSHPSSAEYGAGLYDPWFYGSAYYPPDVGLTPPPDGSDDAPKPTHPIATPTSYQNPTPRPMPSIPSTPRISTRR